VPRSNVPISLNLNVRTVTAREFQGFHLSLGNTAAKMLIEIHVVDILADTREFAHARDLLRDLGYRVLIDGVSPLMPRHVNLEPLAPDLVKIWWSPAVLSAISDDHEQHLRELVAARGPENVILARTDSEQAVHWALPLGIRRFQGFFVDQLASALQPTRAA
jgi:EAL domain-containing protein (putative c-di-GMP-specific phosphodiesterase class I)